MEEEGHLPLCHGLRWSGERLRLRGRVFQSETHLPTEELPVWKEPRLTAIEKIKLKNTCGRHHSRLIFETRLDFDSKRTNILVTCCVEAEDLSVLNPVHLLFHI